MVKVKLLGVHPFTLDCLVMGGEIIGNGDGALDEIQSIVEGNIECVQLGNGAHAYINDDGKGVPLPPNLLATVFCHEIGALDPSDFIAGNMLILGDGEMGEEADVPAWVGEWFDKMAERAGAAPLDPDLN